MLLSYFQKKVKEDKKWLKGSHDSIATCTLMIGLGETVFFSAGSEKNVKITTADDIDIFEALLNVKAKDWIRSDLS